LRGKTGQSVATKLRVWGEVQKSRVGRVGEKSRKQRREQKSILTKKSESQPVQRQKKIGSGRVHQSDRAAQTD